MEQEEYYQGNDGKQGGDEQNKVVRHEIPQPVSVQTAGIAEREALDIIVAYYVDSPVEELEQTFVADLHSERPVVIAVRLQHGKPVELPVLEDVVGPQSVQRSTADLTREHSFKTFIGGLIEHDFSPWVVGKNEIVLHAVVFIDCKQGRLFLGEGSLVNQFHRCRNHGIGLVDAVLLGIVQSASDGERYIY